MAQKRRQPLCVTGGGFKPPFLHGGVLAWVKGEDLIPKFTLLGEREGLWCSHSWNFLALLSGHPTTMPLKIIWSQEPREREEKKNHQKKRGIKESKQHTAEPSALVVSRQAGQAGRGRNAYLQLGLNLTRFPSGKNLQVARDLQRESRRRGGTAEPSTRGKEEEGKGLPMLTETPPRTPGQGHQRTLMPTWYSRTFFRARTCMWLDT